eukprot:2387727-Prymnesium_polylepis.1
MNASTTAPLCSGGRRNSRVKKAWAAAGGGAVVAEGRRVGANAGDSVTLSSNVTAGLPTRQLVRLAAHAARAAG